MSRAPDSKLTAPVALLGGTFDPVHFGHLRAALEVRAQLQLETIHLLPAGRPAHRTRQVTGSDHRLNMLRLAIAGTPGLEIDQRELSRPGPSYMADTLAEIRAERRNTPLMLVIGQDSANALDTWHCWRELFGLAHLVIMTRPGDHEAYPEAVAKELGNRTVTIAGGLLARPAGAVLRMEVTGLSISSSAIRAMLRSGSSPRFLLPDTVLEYIHQHGLYSD